jgi:hypothetical protein
MAFVPPLVAALAAAACWALDRAGILPFALRDRPWPFALVIAIAALAAWRLRPRKTAVASLGAIIAVTAGFMFAVHQRYRLPESQPGISVGSPIGEIALDDERAMPVPVASPRGGPTLIALYRGTW